MKIELTMKREKGGMNDTWEEMGAKSLHAAWSLILDIDRLQAGEEIGYKCNTCGTHINLYVYTHTHTVMHRYKHTTMDLIIQ